MLQILHKLQLLFESWRKNVVMHFSLATAIINASAHFKFLTPPSLRIHLVNSYFTYFISYLNEMLCILIVVNLLTLAQQEEKKNFTTVLGYRMIPYRWIRAGGGDYPLHHRSTEVKKKKLHIAKQRIHLKYKIHT